MITMRILFLMKVFEVGGQEVVTSVLANYFIEQGHRVSLASFLPPSDMMVKRLNKNIQVYTLGNFKKSSHNVNQLHNILEKEKIDIVINQWGLPYIPAKVLDKARRNLNLKVISIYHNDPLSNARLKDVEIALDNTKNPLKKIVLNTKLHLFKVITSLSMRYVYNHSDLYMVLSPCYTEHFIRFTNIKEPKWLLAQTNPVTIDSSDYIYDSAVKRKEIIYVGRIDYNQKRVYRVIDTWALLEDKYPNWKLTIVGDGPERVNIEKQVKELGLQRVSFEGFQQPKEYYKRASMLMLTSEYEGFPLVLAECMSFGVVPAVYGSYSAVYDIIEDGKDGIILPFDEEKGFNAEKMAERMAAIMDSPETLQTMAVQAVEKSKEYSIDKIARQWEELMGKLANKIKYE